MRKTIILSLVAAVILFGMLGTVFAREAPKNDKHSMDYLNKPTGEPRYQLLNINNMWFWQESNGEASHSRGGDSGTYFPRGYGVSTKRASNGRVVATRMPNSRKRLPMARESASEVTTTEAVPGKDGSPDPVPRLKQLLQAMS
jgi:hypothetical protein